MESINKFISELSAVGAMGMLLLVLVVLGALFYLGLFICFKVHKFFTEIEEEPEHVDNDEIFKL